MAPTYAGRAITIDADYVDKTSASWPKTRT